MKIGQKFIKPDHSHKCCRCGRVWKCRAFSLKYCRSGGVFKAVTVNKDGPYCHKCQQDEMDERARLLERT